MYFFFSTIEKKDVLFFSMKNEEKSLSRHVSFPYPKRRKQPKTQKKKEEEEFFIHKTERESLLAS